jgi:hypothetical protein
MALPCTAQQIATWERRCFDIGSRRVNCSQLDAGTLAIGQYEIAYYSPDGTRNCYAYTATDVGDEVVTGVHGVITDAYNEVYDGLIFWATVAATAVFFGIGAWLVIKELRKL